ncbi:hypothetical protein HETIRDRAFT_422723 [Heterobasidion irregulare TC 32-1]|uniref:Uncharacterized protein n=1 Tax=Heterobasidion irregulare (strain TC 32-1) TaxID=747525 RepID=W4JRH9_HETIT|nr:uncharacterized protein HETIRDRAFT_422723 [Heterobasidion irregulare TC 32-1]ETW76148.1 hypothetical protein HETIRDRAFT_422723 [Heterobasidion irregulare TC 32-1]
MISGARVHGCHSSLSFDTYRNLATPWEAQMLFDITVFGLTLVQSYKHRENLRWFRGLQMERSGTLELVELLFRDVMALVNLANVLTFYDPLRGSLSTFASCVSITMMSRLVLNLHDASLLLPSQHPTTSSMTFASMRDARKSISDGTEMLPSNHSDAETQDSATRAIELSRIERPQSANEHVQI